MKKLIYFTLGNQENYIKLASLCIDSLYLNGYDGDFLFITNFKNQLLESIKFNREPYFLECDNTDLLSSSSNKLKIYEFDKINEFDKIIYSDLDILWLSNPDIIFDLIVEDTFYVSNEDFLISDEYWGGKIINNDEKNYIIQNNIKGINAGIFAFNQNMINHLKEMELFLIDNKHLVNSCLEQPFLNTYLFRNKLYSNVLNNYVSHKGYVDNNFNGVVLHFAGGPGNFETKFSKMNETYKNKFSMIKKFDNRNQLLETLPKNLTICEIGVFKGEFSKIIFETISPNELHLIDIFEGEMCSGDKDGNNIVWTNLSEEFVNLKNYFSNNDNVFVHKGLSYQVMDTFNDNYFDLIYIDGDHSYEGVKKDLSISLLKTKKDGYICGHDYVEPRFEGVVRAVNEFCNENNLTISHLTNDGCPTYCIRKK